eukprot:CFRG2940T1
MSWFQPTMDTDIDRLAVGTHLLQDEGDETNRLDLGTHLLQDEGDETNDIFTSSSDRRNSNNTSFSPPFYSSGTSDDGCTIRNACLGFAIMTTLLCIFGLILVSRQYLHGSEERSETNGVDNLTELLPNVTEGAFVFTSIVTSTVFATSTVMQTVTATTTDTISPTPIGDVSASGKYKRTNLVTSEGDRRQYRYRKLSNNMPILLVSDSEATTSSAAMGVACGAYHDPDTALGLAHLTEHVLFIAGSTKYPGINPLDKFVSSHAGNQVNAWTSTTATVYYYDVGPKSFSNSLELFSAFFVDHTLKREDVAQEINAVNAEYERDIPNNDRKAAALFATRMKKDHYASRFTIGSKQSLVDDPLKTKTNIFDNMKEYLQLCYRSENMNLVLTGPHGLDDLDDMAVEFFTDVPSGPKPPPLDLDSPYKENMNGFFMARSATARTVRMLWQFESEKKYALNSPLSYYLGHLIRDQGEGSILKTLMADELALGLRFELDVQDGWSIFEVIVEVTESGIERWPSVVSRVKQYIALMHSMGPQEHIFDHQQMSRQCSWKYQISEDPLTVSRTMAARLTDNIVGPENILHPPSAFVYDSEAVESTLRQAHENMFLTLIFDPDSSMNYTQVESLFMTPYTYFEYTNVHLETFSNKTLDPRLRLPKETTYSCNPTDLQILPKIVIPSLYGMNNSVDHLWYAQDLVFGAAYFDIQTLLLSPPDKVFKLPGGGNYGIGSVEVNLYFTLITAMLEEAARSVTNDAHRASISTRISASSSKLIVEISGMSDHFIMKFKPLIMAMLPRTTESGILNQTSEHDQRFNDLVNIALKNVKRHLRISSTDNAITQARQKLAQLLLANAYSSKRKEEALRSVTAKSIRQFLLDFLQDVRIEMIATGNLRKEEAVEFLQFARSNLPPSVSFQLPSHNHNLHYIAPSTNISVLYTKLNSQRIVMEMNNTNKEDETNVILMYMQTGGDDARTVALTSLIVAMSSERAFTVLRTKEQLGYAVSFSSLFVGNTLSIALTIQSSRHPRYLQTRAHSFLNVSQLKYLRNLTEEEFSTFRNGVMNSLNRGDSSRTEMNSRVLRSILSERSLEDVRFDKDQDVVRALKDITKTELLTFYEHVVNSSFTVQIISQAITDWKDDAAIATTPKKNYDVKIISPREYFEALGVDNRIGEV